jgi:hypothetical protein
MRLKDAKKLQNRDEVKVRKETGGWEYGHVLGTPFLISPKQIIIQVQNPSDGYREVSHLDVR